MANDSEYSNEDESNCYVENSHALPNIDSNTGRRKNARKVSFNKYDTSVVNPNYYLPDGTLKRRFSLPKLKDALEMVKHCRYLRKFSIDRSIDPDEKDFEDVRSIFKDTDTSIIEKNTLS